MRRLARIVAGVVVVAALAYVWLPAGRGYWIPLSMVLMGLVGGLLMGSRWSILLAPAGIMAGGWLWGRIECPDCPPATDPTPGERLFLATVLFGLAALGAWAGTAGARLVSGARRLPHGPGDS